MSSDREAFGQFLRSRRDRLSPAQAGITPFPGRRRVPGLRKEELAVLVGLSADHYSRLEQGRQHTISDDVLAALCRALRLDDVESAHLRDLSTTTSRRPSGAEAAQRPDPGLLRVLTALDGVPALLLGRRADVLATNRLLGAVLGTDLGPGDSFVRWLLLDRQARERIVNWDDFARASIGALRYEAGRRPHDGRLVTLVDELCSADPVFDRWWHDHGVTDQTSLTKRISHPIAGPLSFGVEALRGPHDPDQRLVVYTVEPDSATARALELLVSWGTDTGEITTGTRSEG